MKKQIKIIASLVLTCCVVLAGAGIVRADSLDLNHKMSLTVQVEGDYADGLCYDLYQIAEIESPVFGFEATDAYSSMSAQIAQAASLVESSDTGWNDVAQQALSLTLGEAGSVVTAPTDADYTGLSMNQTYSVEAGLYLLVTRGAGDNETVLTALTQEDGTQQLATYTLIDTHTYTVSPQLVCLPSKDGTSLSGGDWQYDRNVTLKMSIDPATGSIIIDKSLTGYYGDAEEAVFVFQVDTYYPTEDELYSSETYALEFTGTGEQTLRIDGIPIDALVQVSEVYSGINYYMASITYPNGLNHLVVTQEPQTVYVSNRYNGNTSGGGGVTNRFSYDADTQEWSWSQEHGNAATSNGIADKLLDLIMKH